MKRTTAPGHSNNQFVDADPQGGVAPSEVDADWLNHIQEEIANVIEQGGGTLDPNSKTQLRDKILALIASSSPQLNLGTATLSGAAYTASAAPSAIPAGFSIRFLTAQPANPTLTVGSTTAPMVDSDGTPIAGIAANERRWVQWDGASFVVAESDAGLSAEELAQVNVLIGQATISDGTNTLKGKLATNLGDAVGDDDNPGDALTTRGFNALARAGNNNELIKSIKKVFAYSFAATLSADTSNYNVAAAATAAGWDGVKLLDATITVAAGVYVYSTTAAAALDTGVVPSGSSITLINNGFIVGKGGNGGGGGQAGGANIWGGTGGTGGLAVRAQSPVTVTNNGTIAGGGGGGGGGGSTACNGPAGGGGGGGGQGYLGGVGAGGGANGGGTGTAGTKTTVGIGGAGVAGFAGYMTGGNGGNGGGLGLSGGSGTGSSSNGCDGSTGAGAGGAAGAAVNGNSFITWVTTGTRAGAIV